MLENVLYKSIIFLPRLDSRMLTRTGFGPWWYLRRAAGPVLGAFVLTSALGFALLGGCAGLRPKPSAQYVYVTAKETFLRDRLAAVTNRTATVENGEKLEVLEHARRYFRVKTPKGEMGWIDEKAVATQEVFDAFQALGAAHKGDPSVASAVARDEVNLHLKPGRQTEVFYRLPEGDKLQLLERATLPKPATGWVAPKSAAQGKAAQAPGAAGPGAATPIAMEDWWLARDAQGRTGWLLSRYEDVDAPDSVAKYAEGQRIVGAYVLATVNDPGADQDDKNIPMYLTLMSPYTAGLPYDFDQVRVFTWNSKMHRYETAFREKNIEGYLPVKIDMQKDPYGKAAVAQTPLPTFTYKVLAADAGPVVPDPATGMVTPGRTIAKTYRLEGNLVRRVAAPGSKDEPEAHPVAEGKKETLAKAKHRR
jgi:uncharacterized protein YgiM (DUF1202 family)